MTQLLGERPRRRVSSRAQALVEFAIVAPIFFLILFAVIDFGRYVYYTQVLNNAAREGTRYAIVHGENGLPPTGPPDDPTGADVIEVVRNYAVGVIGLEDTTVLDIQVSWNPDNSRDSKVTVTVDYAFNSVMTIVPIPPISVRGASSLVLNN